MQHREGRLVISIIIMCIRNKLVRIPWPDGPAPTNLRHQDGFTFDLGVVKR